MASGFFAILDDIASLMDDVALTSKIATQKTAGILGDDLAVNAEKATGFVASREIPVLWAITKGSFVNKLILVPIALFLNHYFPEAIVYILLLGGCYLAYEGVEKIVDFLFHHDKEHREEAHIDQIADPDAEKTKIRSAIITDFILSVEIVIIALSTVLHKDLTTQILTVSFVAIIATIGVYGIVMLIVRMDDAGLFLVRKSKDKNLTYHLGQLLIKALPRIINILSIVGTIALLTVSGGIFVHGFEYLHHIWPGIPALLKELLLGLIVGTILVCVMLLGKMILNTFKKKKQSIVK